MAKKTTRPNIPQATLERARKELYGGAVEMIATPDAASDAAPVKKVVRVKREINLREEYAYVIKDLRNMATLAGVLMATLLILALSGVV